MVLECFLIGKNKKKEMVIKFSILKQRFIVWQVFSEKFRVEYEIKVFH